MFFCHKHGHFVSSCCCLDPSINAGSYTVVINFVYPVMLVLMLILLISFSYATYLFL